MLITRFYGQNEDIFFLSKDIEIKVEVPNTFIDFFEKFPILSLFQIKGMKIANLPPLIVPKQLDSNIQLVANYLKALNENMIEARDLIFPKITPDVFKDRFYLIKKPKQKIYPIQAELLSEDECQKLIFNTINKSISLPTYYQINSFINVLAIQLKKFNQNFFLNAYQLATSKGTKACTIRSFIIQSFIKLTRHFTEGAFTNLLKEQEDVHKVLFFSLPNF